jgi:hypothetical protein
MSLTKAYLESVTESIKNYQIRRVRWASAKLEEQGEEVKPWKVIWIAGLGENYSEKVKAALEDKLYRQSTAMASFNETLVDTY